jgi:hypothetical protein
MRRRGDATAITFLCGLAAALLFFTAAPAGAGDATSVALARNTRHKAATSSVPEISFPATRLLGLAAHSAREECPKKSELTPAKTSA